MLAQFIFNGIVTGSIYALVALGFALIYNTTRIFHIAYAPLYMLSPYLFLTCYDLLKKVVISEKSFFFSFLKKRESIFLLLAFGVAVLTVMLISILMERIVYKPLINKRAPSNVMMISSIGTMIILINLVALLYGNETKILNRSISPSAQYFGVIVTKAQLLQLGVASSIILVFWLFLKFTQFGIKTRAMRDDPILCQILGINITRLRVILFGLSGLMAAVGGSLVAWDVGMDPYVGMPILLNAMVALIIGGMGRFEAPVLGGFIIGILHALTVWLFSARWQDAITFVLLAIFLLFRPHGIMGERRREV